MLWAYPSVSHRLKAMSLRAIKKHAEIRPQNNGAGQIKNLTFNSSKLF